MTKHTAGILGSLTAEALRAMTDAELDAKATAIEDTSDGDGFMSTADEADLCLINREQARREDEAAAAPVARGWYLATTRKTLDAPIVRALIQARDGAEVEHVIKSWELDGVLVRWEPLADLVYGRAEGELVVLPWLEGR